MKPRKYNRDRYRDSYSSSLLLKKEAHGVTIEVVVPVLVTGVKVDNVREVQSLQRITGEVTPETSHGQRGREVDLKTEKKEVGERIQPSEDPSITDPT